MKTLPYMQRLCRTHVVDAYYNKSLLIGYFKISRVFFSSLDKTLVVELSQWNLFNADAGISVRWYSNAAQDVIAQAVGLHYLIGYELRIQLKDASHLRGSVVW